MVMTFLFSVSLTCCEFEQVSCILCLWLNAQSHTDTPALCYHITWLKNVQLQLLANRKC